MPTQSHSRSRTEHVMSSHSMPTHAFTLGSIQSVHYHNEGVDFLDAGQYGAAEQALLTALVIKNRTIGADGISTALTHNALGELYIALNRLDDAERHLLIAVRIRNADAMGPTFDAARSRETLAVVYEMRGNLVAAKQMRKSTGKFACGSFLNCRGRVYNRSGLRQCARCTAIFYCTPECQKADWERHKKYCRKLESNVEV